MNDLSRYYKKAKAIKLRRLLQSITLTFCLLGFKSIIAQNVAFQERSTITNEGLYFWYPNKKDGTEVKAYHYNPNISPRGDCFTVVNGYIFFGWYKGGMKKRDLMISRKKIGSGSWVTVQLPHKNTLIGPKVNSWGDSHNTISVAVSKTDGTIHIFYDHHNDPLKYIVSKPGTAFVKNSDFKIGIFEKTRGYLAEGQNITITYPQLTENDAGDIILNYRKGSAVGGNEMVHVYNSRNSTWSRSKMVLRGSGKPHVAEKDRNYAYGAAPVLAGGNIYYGFSVRWARKKPDGILNEGMYLAKCGPTMTSNFIGVDVDKEREGVNYKLPVQDYSPFLIDLPKTKNGAGSSGGPSIAVSNAGDVHLSFRSRGKNASKYYYTYVRKAGEKEFTIHSGISKTGIAYGDRIYHTAISKSSGTITIQSTQAGAFDYRNDLVYETGEVLGNSVVRLVDGKLVIVSEDRSNKKTDSQNVFCFVFQIGDEIEGDSAPETPVDLTGAWYKIKNAETGRYMRSMGGGNIIAASVNSGNDKQWQFIKAGDFYNIDSKTNADGIGILRATKDNIIGTKRSAPREDVDKVWSFKPTTTGSYYLELKNTGRFIYNQTNDGNKIIELSTKQDDRSKWTLERVSSAKQADAKKVAQTEMSISVYPNPTNDKFNIVVNGMEGANLKIISMLGKLIYSSTVIDNRVELSKTDGFASGLYIIQLTGENTQVYSKKLLIN